MNKQIAKLIIFQFFILTLPLSSQEIKYKLIKTEKVVGSIHSWHFVSDCIFPIAVQDNKIKWIDSTKPDYIPLLSGYVNTVFSRTGKYLGIISLLKENTDRKIFQLEVFSNAGKNLSQIKRHQYYDEPLPVVAISDKNGLVIIGHSAIGKLWFYNQNGSQFHEVDLFSDDEYALERSLQFDISEDGQYIAVLATKKPATLIDVTVPEPSGEPHLFLFNIEGKEVWQLPLPEFNAARVAISPNGHYLVASSYTSDTKGNIEKSTILFHEDSQKIADYELLFRTASFSNDSKFMVLAEKSIVKCIKLSTGQIKWTHKISVTQGMIVSARIANSANYSVLLTANNEFKEGAFIYTNPRMIVLNRSGQKIQDIEINKSFYTPALCFSSDHKYIYLGLNDSYQVYQVKLLN